MTCWEILNINKTRDKGIVLDALVSKVSAIDFMQKADNLFDCLKAYRQCMVVIDEQDPGRNILYPWETSHSKEEDVFPYLDEENIYQTPEQLILRFTELYGDLTTRFNVLYWKSAIANVKLHTTINLKEYCRPIIDFLASHCFVKTDVIQELKKHFPLQNLFSSKEWKEADRQKRGYGYAEHLIRNGNFELDLQIDALLPYSFPAEQLDVMLGNLAQSMYYARQKDFARAYNVLAENIPDKVKPLLIKQREINILFRAAIIENQEPAKPHFVNELNKCLERFPGDEHFLFLRALYMYKTITPDKAIAEIIATLKVNPTNTKCIFLLGKCYLKLQLFRNAYTVFKSLMKLEPLNVEYSAFSAVAMQGMLQEQSLDKDLQKDKTHYIEQVIQLIELNLYEEINDLPSNFEGDPDIKALQMLATASERHYFEDVREIALLDEALEYAQSPEIVLRIVRKQLAFHPLFGEIAQRKDFIFKYLEIFPDDDVINNNAGSYYLQAEDYAKALQYYKKANELNSENIDAYLGIARAAEYLKDYQLAIDNSLVYQHAYKYSPIGYEILGRCAYNMRDYYTCFQSYKWIISLRYDNRATVPDQFFLVNSLYNFIKTKQIDIEKYPVLAAEIEEVVELFDSLPKGEEFMQHPKGMTSYFWAANLCSFIGLHEKGLKFADKAIEISLQNGNSNLGDLARDKAAFLAALERYNDVVDFLVPHLDLHARNTPQDRSRLFECGFLLARAYENLGNWMEEYKWRLANIEMYYEIEGHDEAWLEGYAITLFDKCLERDSYSQAKETGNLYLLAIENPCRNHIYVCYWLAEAYAKEGNFTSSNNYYRRAIGYAEDFPEEYQELVASARNKIESEIKEQK